MAYDDNHEYEDDDLLDDDSFVRPFIITGGRGESSLPVEVMVVVSGNGSALVPNGDEYRRIIKLCREAQSIAEVSAHCKLPLGVVRVLVSDLVDCDVLTVAAHDKLETVDELAFLDKIIAAVELI